MLSRYLVFRLNALFSLPVETVRPAVITHFTPTIFHVCQSLETVFAPKYFQKFHNEEKSGRELEEISINDELRFGEKK